jgi:hypothetical protein
MIYINLASRMRAPKGDVWLLKKPRLNGLHPTMNPVGWVERAIRNSSKSRNVVLDTFGGYYAAEMAKQRLAEFEAEWGKKYPAIRLGMSDVLCTMTRPIENTMPVRASTARPPIRLFHLGLDSGKGLGSDSEEKYEPLATSTRSWWIFRKRLTLAGRLEKRTRIVHNFAIFA